MSEADHPWRDFHLSLLALDENPRRAIPHELPADSTR